MRALEKASRELKKPSRAARPHEGDLEDLKRSLKRYGVLQPIIAKPNGEVVIGQRRAEAAKLLGIRVPVVVRADLADEMAALEARLSEELSHTPWDRVALAEEIRKLYESHKERNKDFTREDLADRLGITVSNLETLFTVAGLPKEIKREVHRGGLSASDARTIAGIGGLKDEEKIRLAKKVAAGKIPGGRKLNEEVAPLIRRAPEAVRKQLVENPRVDYWQAARHVVEKERKDKEHAKVGTTVRGFVATLVERLKFWRLAFHSAKVVVPFIPETQWQMLERVIRELIEDLEDALKERTKQKVTEAQALLSSRPEKIIDLVKTSEDKFGTR